MADILNFFNIKTADYYNILTIYLRKRGWIVLYNMHQNRISSFQWCELLLLWQPLIHGSSRWVSVWRTGEPILNCRMPVSWIRLGIAAEQYLISSRGLWGEFKGNRRERVTWNRASLFRPNPTANPVSASKRGNLVHKHSRVFWHRRSHERVLKRTLFRLLYFWINWMLPAYCYITGVGVAVPSRRSMSRRR